MSRRARDISAALIVAPWGVWAIVRVLGLDRVYPVVPGVAFTPWAAVASFAAVGVALLLRSWAAAAVAAAAALALVIVIAPRVTADDQPNARGEIITLMSVNMLAGRADAREIVELVRGRDVDILSLQELTPEAVAALRRAGLERTLAHGLDESRYAVAGAGLWSRERLRRGAPTDPRWWSAPEGVIEKLKLRVRAVHPRPPISPEAEPVWRANIAAMPTADPKDSELRIIAGDFNATLDHRVLRRLIDRGYTDAAEAAGKGLIRTWPSSGWPSLTIDHVLVDRRIAVRGFDVFTVSGSDHRALIARLQLP
ncbi:MAG: endonuclease/exonuclease/phosphatase family protein [Solirubrobacterales bacterium]